MGSDTTWYKVSRSGGFCTFAIKTDNTLWSWGYNGRGQLGQNSIGVAGGPTYVGYSSPVQIPGTTWKEVVTNGQQVGALKTDGTLWMWGSNNYGNLGQNNLTKYSSPTQVPGTTWNAVRCAGNTTYVNKTDGTLWVWGWNGNGEAGVPYPSYPSSISSPVQIPGTNWKSVQEYGFGASYNGASILQSS